jgi:hypothetical protein
VSSKEGDNGPNCTAELVGVGDVIKEVLTLKKIMKSTMSIKCLSYLVSILGILSEDKVAVKQPSEHKASSNANKMVFDNFDSGVLHFQLAVLLFAFWLQSDGEPHFYNLIIYWQTLGA